MKLLLKAPNKRLHSTIAITGSKSESNRLLLLKAIFPEIQISNLSNSDDSKLMEAALVSEKDIIDIHHAGTAMRFLTSFFATQEGREIVLTGSSRMQERPVKILVDALSSLGASITYEKNEGYPPLRIKGKRLSKSEVTLKANVSSQYISSLLLVGASLENGINLYLDGEITSLPYLKMTIALLEEIGIRCDFNKNHIKVYPAEVISKTDLVVESDWSSASYFYSLAALSEEAAITLKSYKEHSLQGDSVLAEIYQFFGVTTEFENNTIRLIKKQEVNLNREVLSLDLTEAPDIAQTIAVSCFGAGKGCHLTGLHTLKIKETDRLEALKIELSKLGAKIEVTDKELILQPSERIFSGVAIDTYHDHRMAMAFAPLALKTNIIINEAEVVSKSYPDFWDDMEKIGFELDYLKS
ncbi:3-phosphoshikimate 1-carboxyvinyltransferase [Ascidiimonas sp. W6]|uniref:3-phosphoshikimate 1-carboxyvinyltransferase n=1 Tax=Ascidiimonas meishanensis TaxID=3128903 RepID=UPI0030EF196C